MAFLEPEPGANACDANGDGDVFDTLLRAVRLGSPEVTNATHRAVDAAPVIDGRSLAVSGGRVFFRTPEWAAAAHQTVRLPNSGHPGNMFLSLQFSADGRFVAYETNPGSSSGEILVLDRQDGTIEVASVNSAGEPSDGVESGVAISADGRFVAFGSNATNLDPCGCAGIYVRDRQMEITEHVAPGSFGHYGGISADGRFVAFASDATDLVPGDTNNQPDVFVHDRLTDQPERVSVDSAENQASDGFTGSFGIGISADGRFVTFLSQSTLAPPNTDGVVSVYVRDRQAGTTERASLTVNGFPANSHSYFPSISADGRIVSFWTNAPNMAPPFQIDAAIYVRDRVAGVTERVASSGIEVSPVSGDGRFVANSIAVYDRVTGLSDGILGFPRAISADGRSVGFDADDPDDPGTNRELVVRGPNLLETTHDLTGDLDQDDTVLQVLDADDGSVTTLCAAGTTSVAGGNAAFLRPESATGGTPACPAGSLNGDADTADDVVYLSLGGAPAQNLARAATDVSLSTAWLGALVSEAGQGGADLNGDGDPTDTVVQVHPAGAGAWTNTGQAADVIEMSGAVAAFITPESSQGAGGADLNADTDTSDRVLQLYDAQTATLTNVGQAAEEFVLGARQATACGDRQLIAFRTLEAAQGGQMLNGDGDAVDSVLEVYDAVTQTLHPTGLAVRPCRFEACDPRLPYRVTGSKVRFLTYEPDQGQDLDGDNFPFNVVLQVFDVCTGVVTVLDNVNEGAGAVVDPLTDPEPESSVYVTSAGRCVAGATTLLVPATCLAAADCPAGSTCQFAGDVVVATDATTDGDGDGVPSALDNAPSTFNPEQEDADDDGVGDVADAQTCGNGTREANEGCDDGNAVNGDGCDAGCVPTGCGNGVLAGGETCDDGNVLSGDGCDANCTPTACGNGIVTAGEECDDGDVASGDGCDANCRPTGCGNGVTTGGEVCDDGNAVNGDGCDANCTPTACGNGITTTDEGCDDGNLLNGDGCESSCVPTGCGSGAVSGAELCDDGNTASGDGCDANCTPTGCGNGLVTAGEQCDDLNTQNGDGCDANCKLTACGNGVVTGDEQCDDGNVLGADGCDANCATEPPGYCPPALVAGCRVPAVTGRARVALKDRDPDDRNHLSWKWPAGAVTTKAELGDPTTTHTYALCLYDASGLVARAVVPAGGFCGGRPCWTSGRTGFRYRNRDLTPNGIAMIRLKEGLEPGKARITVRGEGALLPMPALGALASPVTVQLRNGTSVCWQAVFSAPFSRQDATQFADVAD